MKNLSGASLLHVVAAARRPSSKLPLPAGDWARGGPGEAAARSLARRLLVALHDLGLAGVVPDGWVSVDGATVTFGDLDVPAADHLVHHLEDIAASVADTTAAVVADRRRGGARQAALFEVES